MRNTNGRSGMRLARVVAVASRSSSCSSARACSGRPWSSRSLGGRGKRDKRLDGWVEVAGRGDERVGVRRLLGSATFGEQPQLQRTRGEVEDVAGRLQSVGDRSRLRERPLGLSELGQGAHASGTHVQRELGHAAPLAEGVRFFVGVECRLRPLVAPKGPGEVAVDDPGFAPLTVRERELERTAHVLDAVRLTEVAAGASAPHERERRLGQVELRSERERPLSGLDRLGRSPSERAAPCQVGVRGRRAQALPVAARAVRPTR